jgi:A/G-specific adenine glycosylase
MRKTGLAQTDAATFAERVLAWHERHGRHDLPWQQPATPYRVWISEIMLQQTRVETVRGYFQRFVDRFPNVESLARAEVDDVLHLWSGLGYYARARNLHRAAQLMLERHDGEVPLSLDELVALPGIGRSTAGAILSLGAGQRQAILDGNVKRVLARQIGLTQWPGRAPATRALWQAAEERTPSQRVAAYNQGMMDLGATVCLRRPLCHLCPVASTCVAYRDATTAHIPASKPKRAVPQRETVVLVLQRRRDSAILLRRRPEQGIWGGLWSLPEFDDRTALEAWLATRLGIDATQPLAPVEHAFTHFRLRLHPHHVVADVDGAVADGDGWAWYGDGDAPGGIPAPVARITKPFLGGGQGVLA